jgi:predicted nucleic acid-binding protein
MDYLLLDTCIVLHILRKNEYGSRCIKAIESYSQTPVFIISTVTKAELESLKVQQHWGEPRCKSMNAFLQQATYVDIQNQDDDLIAAYAKIDAYSNRKGSDNSGNLLPNSAKTMAKNDLWIAATAYTLNVPLLTADGNFDHLNGTFLNVMKVV